VEIVRTRELARRIGMPPLRYRCVPRAGAARAREIGTPVESGHIYELLTEIIGSNGRPDDARHLRQQGKRKFPKDKGLTLPPTQ